MSFAQFAHRRRDGGGVAPAYLYVGLMSLHAGIGRQRTGPTDGERESVEDGRVRRGAPGRLDRFGLSAS